MASGYVSPEAARDAYGVAVSAEGEVDDAATAALRTGPVGSSAQFAVEADERSPYSGIRGRQRRLRLNEKAAARLGLGAGDLVEMIGSHAAPLRAWVLVDDGAPADAVGLDGFARRVLGVETGADVTLRKLITVVRPGERV